MNYQLLYWSIGGLVTLLALVIAVLYDMLRKIFDSISKK
jgi:hypothetical protein